MASPEHVRAEVESWIDETWDPEMTVAQWWAAMAAAGLTSPTLPEPHGRGHGRGEARAVSDAIRTKKVLGPPGGLGMLLAAPTILHHGSDEQIETYVPAILNGTESWCQLFSEPGAGSDLAGLQTRAVKDGDEWIVSGQKVWTSNGHQADWGMLIARTDPNQPKHQGITYFAFPMQQDGVDVRPLQEMTGRALFNEVFIDEGRVPDANMIGDLGAGWRVANTTLMVERSGIGGGAAFSAAAPGGVVGHLDRPAGDFVGKRSALSAGGVGQGTVHTLMSMAADDGRNADPIVRQDLSDLQARVELMRMAGLRAKAGGASSGEGNLAKLRMTEALRRGRHTFGEIVGPQAQLWGEDTVTNGALQEMIVFSPAPSIYGGTDEIQRNIIGERVLGLPKEPGHPKDTPFKDLPSN